MGRCFISDCELQECKLIKESSRSDRKTILGLPVNYDLNSDAEKDTCSAVLEGTAYCMFSLTTRANYDRIGFELCQKTVSNRSDLFTYNSKV